jgi:hypothetical protein
MCHNSKHSLKEKKKKKRRGREGESTEKWGRKIMGLGKNQKWERRSSGAPSCRRGRDRGEVEKEHGELGEKSNGFRKKI